MESEKLILCSIVQNEEEWLPLMLESVKDGIKKVILVDSGCIDDTLVLAKKFCYENKIPLKVLYFKRENKSTDDGRQRNVYLKYLKQKHLGEWALVLDADEVWKGKLLESFNENLHWMAKDITCYDLKFRHLLSNFGTEDATLPEHWTRRRMFKVQEKLFYPETEHNVLSGLEDKECTKLLKNEVFHFAHCRKSGFYWKNKFDGAMQRSELHPPEFKEKWYYAHLFGLYPSKKLNPEELPTVIKDKFFVKHDIKPMKTLISIATVPGNEVKLSNCLTHIFQHTHEEYQLLVTVNNWRSFSYGHNKALSKALIDDEIEGVVLLNDDANIINFKWLEYFRDASEGKNIVGCNDSGRMYEDRKYTAFYCTYIPKEIIKKVGFLDEQFKIAECEDVDYSWRAIDAGFDIRILKPVIVNHETSSTLGNLDYEKDKERIKNQERFRKKWQLKTEEK